MCPQIGKQQIADCRRYQRAICFVSRSARRPYPPSRRRPFRFSNRALVTSLHSAGPKERRASVCGSAVALRTGCDSLIASLRSPLHLSRSPTTDRSQKSAYVSKVMNSPISDWPVSDFPITDWKIGKPFGSSSDSAMKPRSIVWRRWSLQDTTGRSLKRSRFRSSLTRPPPPGSFASRFSSREVCLLERRFNWIATILRCYFFAILC